MEGTVLEIISNLSLFQSHEIKKDHTLKELGLDDLDKLDLVMKLEKEFDIHISDFAIEKTETVEQVINLVKERI